MHQANIKRMKLIKDTRLIVGYDRHAIHYNKSVIKKIKLLKKERRKIHSYKLVTASTHEVNNWKGIMLYKV